MFLSLQILFPQDVSIPGKPVLELFTDLHYNLNGDSLQTNGFGINRAYFGYNYIIDPLFSASIVIDIGYPEDLSAGAKTKRYAHFREASVSYTGKRLNITMGITGTRIFNYQQTFWGKRFIAKPYQSINGYGFLADIGVVADYMFSKKFSGDISIMNGKGYSNPQADNNLKASLGFTYIPVSAFSLRFYSDIMKVDELWQGTLVGFAGLKTKVFYIGAEFNYKSNLDKTEGHHALGFSSTSSLNLTEKAEFFIRYDYSSSVIASGDVIKWNYQKDGSFIIGGFQYSFNKYVKFALDYQTFMPYYSKNLITDMVYLNALVKF